MPGTRRAALGGARGRVRRRPEGCRRHAAVLSTTRTLEGRTAAPLGAGVRSLAYGSLLGLLGVGLAGTAAVHLSGVRSSEDFRGALREALLPLLGSVRAWALPLKARAQVRRRTEQAAALAATLRGCAHPRAPTGGRGSSHLLQPRQVSAARPCAPRPQAWIGRVDPATGPGVSALQRRLGVATRRPRADPARAEGPG